MCKYGHSKENQQTNSITTLNSITCSTFSATKENRGKVTWPGNTGSRQSSFVAVPTDVWLITLQRDTVIFTAYAISTTTESPTSWNEFNKC